MTVGVEQVRQDVADAPSNGIGHVASIALGDRTQDVAIRPAIEFEDTAIDFFERVGRIVRG